MSSVNVDGLGSSSSGGRRTAASHFGVYLDVCLAAGHKRPPACWSVHAVALRAHP